MSYASEMIDDLRDRLNDATDAQIPFAAKLLNLNRGLAAMFPRIYRLVRDTTLVVADDTFEYTFPAGVGTGKVISVEVETDVASNRYVPYQDYDILPSGTTPILVVGSLSLPAAVGARFRILTADRLVPFVAASYAASGNVLYTGPVGTEELPVLYAMGIVAGRRIDDRTDHRRYSSTAGQNGVAVETLEATSQFWFNLFERLLDQFEMPFPVARN